MKTFFYVMAVFPEVLRKAQQEIDRVVGRDRLPTFEDWESLPYTEAIMREVLRWKPILPLGAPRRVTEDDFYKGYLIPKGGSRDTAVPVYLLIVSLRCLDNNQCLVSLPHSAR
jgi:cytochrome P450